MDPYTIEQTLRSLAKNHRQKDVLLAVSDDHYQNIARQIFHIGMALQSGRSVLAKTETKNVFSLIYVDINGQIQRFFPGDLWPLFGAKNPELCKYAFGQFPKKGINTSPVYSAFSLFAFVLEKCTGARFLYHSF